MELKASKHFLLLLVLFFLVASSFALNLSTGNRKLMSDEASSSEKPFSQEGVANETSLEEFMKRRMLDRIEAQWSWSSQSP